MQDIRPVRKIRRRPDLIKKIPKKEDRWLKLRAKIFNFIRWPKFLRRRQKSEIPRKEKRKFLNTWEVRSDLVQRSQGKKVRTSVRPSVSRTPSRVSRLKKGVLTKFRKQTTDFWEGVKDLSQKDKMGFKETKVQKKWYQRWWFHFIILGFYVALTLAMTYPLMKYFKTAIPGDGGDGGIFLWDMWWIKHALLDLRQDPFLTDLLAFPHKVDLTFHTLALSNSLISIPFQKLFGLVPAFNLVFLLNFVLTGWGTYFLIRYLTKSTLAGIIAGVMMAFAPFVMIRSLGHFNLATIWPIPFFLFFWFKMLYERKWYPAIFAGLFAGILCLNELQYAVMFAVFVAILYLFHLIAEPKRFLISTFLIKTILMLSVALLIFSPLLFPAIVNYQENRLEKITLSRYMIYAADLVRFVVPSHLSTFFGHYADKVKTLIPGGGTEGTVFLGYTTLFFSTLGVIFAGLHFQLRRHKKKYDQEENKLRIWPWLVSGLVFVILALGPFLQFAGHHGFRMSNLRFVIALPFLAIYRLPFLGDIRAPSRFAAFGVIALIIAAGIGLGYLFRNLSKIKWGWLKYPVVGLLFCACLGGAIVELLTVPMPLVKTKIPAIYQTIKDDPEDFTVLDLPCGFSTGYYGFGKPQSIVQTYQTFHQKKLINAFISRFNRNKVEMYLTAPGLNYLIEYWKPVTIAENYDREKIRETLQKFKVKYIVLHRKYFSSGEKTRLDIYLTYVVGLEKFYDNDGVWGYLVQ